MALLWASNVFAQQEYFTPENKRDGLAYYKKQFYKTCTRLKPKQDPVPPEEIRRLAAEVTGLVGRSYRQAFAENPKVRAALERDLAEVAASDACQREANDCRARLAGLAMFYVERFRPDVPGCEGYVAVPASAAGHKEPCENELRYRKMVLQGVHGSNYGTAGPGMYKKQIVYLKNHVAYELFKLAFKKDKSNLHLCDAVPSGAAYHYGVDFKEPGSYYVGLDPDFDVQAQLPPECEAEKKNLLFEFLPAPFDGDRITVRPDEVAPVRALVAGFLAGSPDHLVTDVAVTVTTSRTPFTVTVDGRAVLDPKSDEKNLALASRRVLHVDRIFEELRTAHPQRASIAFRAKAELAGPAFRPMDLNDRFVTRMTPGYVEKIEALFRSSEREFRERALVTGPGDLLDEKKYVNLYQARFKPFHGYRVLVRGFRKDELRCVPLLDKDGTTYYSKR